MLIIGAGIAGCIAAVLNQNAQVIEPAGNKTTHKALLRFRSPDIGTAVGIPFKEVTVYKGIWHNDQSVPLTPRAIALYSRKTSDAISYRSITNQEPTQRWIAPLDFHDQLKDICGDRIEYNVDLRNLVTMQWDIAISTIPMQVLAELLFEPIAGLESTPKVVTISKYKVPGSSVHMTYYYTDPTVHVYRASLEDEELIIESMWDISEEDVATVKRSFGLSGLTLDPIVENHKQQNGKITAVDEDARKEFIVDITERYNIYALGRFATWRNLVLDDVYKDILKIKELSNKSRYDKVIKK